MDHSEVLEHFGRAADAVAQILATNSDWGASRQRETQYAVDVTADRACLDVLYAAGFTVLSEESGITLPDGTALAANEVDGPVVVVDPLDGSTNAAQHIPWFATALCLVDADGPLVALVANHATGERFSAIRGQGAYRHAQAISGSGQTELSQAIIGASGLPTHHYGWAQFRVLGASAPDICAVACGVLDGWVDMTGNGAHGVWDYLASVLILTEAGGVAADVAGRNLCVLDHDARRGPVVAASPELLDALLAQRRAGSVGAHGED